MFLVVLSSAVDGENMNDEISPVTLLEKLPVVKFDRRRMLGIAIGTVAATMFGPLGMAGAA